MTKKEKPKKVTSKRYKESELGELTIDIDMMYAIKTDKALNELEKALSGDNGYYPGVW